MKSSHLYILAFLEGACVAAIELIGGKMLAPVFGSSIYIWTSVIGITLFCLTAGYLIGGGLSVRENRLATLFFLIAMASVTAGAMPLIAEKVLPFFLEVNVFVGCVLMSLLLLSIPLVCLGATSPLTIQLCQQGVHRAGRVAGRFYMISTIGGIFSTLFLGFFILPAFGVRVPLLFCSLALVLGTLLVQGIKWRARMMVFAVSISACVFVFFFTGKKNSNPTFQYVYESEGVMGQLKVVDYWSENNVLSRALLTNNSAQSIITKTNVTAISQYNYVHFISAVSALKPANANVLLLGMAGGSLVYELQKQGFLVDVVDIDERMFYIAERYFYFQKTRTNLITDDARHYVRTSKKKYDMVIIDISSSELQPSYLYTAECFREIKNMLEPEGLFFINFQGVLQGHSTLATATWSVYATLVSAGFHTYYYSFSKNKADDVQFVSSFAPVDFRTLDSSRINLCCTENLHVQKFLSRRLLDSVAPGDVIPLILTDDKPILEKLKFETVMESRNTIRKDILKRLKLNR